jgi:hypothetical protein
MAAKHRKPSRRSRLARRWVPSVTAAAVTATGLSTAVVTGTAPIAPLPAVELAALITPANSTSQIFAASTYYGVDYTDPQLGYAPPVVVVPFLFGPQGIVDAVDRNGSDPNNAVLSSGWGAGQTSTALAIMQANNDPALNTIKLVILDNNTNRAGGGFWTTYWVFAPLLLTSAEPTPDDLPLNLVDVSYEYNINSDAPTDPLNLFADANSLVAYALSYAGQSAAPMPPEALDPVAPGAQHYHYIVAPDGTVAEKIPVTGNITYVTFQSNGLPLVAPLRLIPGGDAIADAIEPTLTRLVNAGYQDGQPIPRDPGVPRPMTLLSSVTQTTSSASAARQTSVPPTSLESSPATTTAKTEATKTEATKTEATKTVDMTAGGKFSPGATTSTSSSRPSDASNPLRQAVTNFTSALGGLANGFTHQTAPGAPNGSTSTTGTAGSTPSTGAAGSTGSTGSTGSSSASN